MDVDVQPVASGSNSGTGPGAMSGLSALMRNGGQLPVSPSQGHREPVQQFGFNAGSSSSASGSGSGSGSNGYQNSNGSGGSNNYPGLHSANRMDVQGGPNDSGTGGSASRAIDIQSGSSVGGSSNNQPSLPSQTPAFPSQLSPYAQPFVYNPSRRVTGKINGSGGGAGTGGGTGSGSGNVPMESPGNGMGNGGLPYGSFSNMGMSLGGPGMGNGYGLPMGIGMGSYGMPGGSGGGGYGYGMSGRGSVGGMGMGMSISPGYQTIAPSTSINLMNGNQYSFGVRSGGFGGMAPPSSALGLGSGMNPGSWIGPSSLIMGSGGMYLGSLGGTGGMMGSVGAGAGMGMGMNGLGAGERSRELEAKFVKDFTCCGLRLNGLHDLLEHYEECHVHLAGDLRKQSMSIPGQTDSSLSSPSKSANGPSQLGPNHTQSTSFPSLTPQPFGSRPPPPPQPATPLNQSIQIDADIPGTPGVMDLELMDEDDDMSGGSSGQGNTTLRGMPNIIPPGPGQWAGFQPAGGFGGGGSTASGIPPTPAPQQPTIPQCVPPSLLSYAIPQPGSAMTQFNGFGFPTGSSINLGGGSRPSGSGSNAFLTPEQKAERAARKAARKEAKKLARDNGEGESSDDGRDAEGFKKYRCPVDGCNKSYKQANGLKYHLQRSINSSHGHYANMPILPHAQIIANTQKGLPPGGIGPALPFLPSGSNTATHTAVNSATNTPTASPRPSAAVTTSGLTLTPAMASAGMNAGGSGMNSPMANKGVIHIN